VLNRTINRENYEYIVNVYDITDSDITNQDRSQIFRNLSNQYNYLFIFCLVWIWFKTSSCIWWDL